MRTLQRDIQITVRDAARNQRCIVLIPKGAAKTWQDASRMALDFSETKAAVWF